MSKRPIIKIEKDTIDWTMDAVGLVCIIGLMVLPFFYYTELPDKIPSHYNGLGEPDAYSSKAVIWTLPIIGTLLFCLLKFLVNFPDKFNYPFKINKQNAKSAYRYGVKTMNWISVFIAGTFLYITHSTILIGLGVAENLGSLFMPLILFLLIGPLIFYVYKMIKVK